MDSDLNPESPPSSPPTITISPSNSPPLVSPSSSYHSADSDDTINPCDTNPLFGTSLPNNPFKSSAMASTPNPTTTTQVSTPPSTLAMILKLSTANFHAWKMRLETCLGTYKLREYILTDIEVPIDPILLDEHITKNFQALNAIHSTVDEENFEVIAQLESTQEAYTLLCKQHGDSEGLSTATLFYNLVNLRLQPGGHSITKISSA
ncbi:hypothetical protein CROQUDRAFT_111099 [Cronartium quercuum f. sp. fusiforme G11]|uniref:Uncharacterized protein n=1 Tax=Cronartium quercuum f. sp. fusiforme G11 TaxID=708437 RepID=A0A9P6T603_9BASI|nr:hypothetical protein CROQUDRAFT_111099 [Cronartium quercuum f. sp. fusiforme G11]